MKQNEKQYANLKHLIFYCWKKKTLQASWREFLRTKEHFNIDNIKASILDGSKTDPKNVQQDKNINFDILMA